MDFDFFISVLLIANGLYDIVCAVSILGSLPVFSAIHASLFQEPLVPVMARLLAYWILTYGVIRLYCGLVSGNKVLAIVSYVIEALCLELEALSSGNSVWPNRAHFVAFLSFGFGCLIIWQF